MGLMRPFDSGTAAKYGSTPESLEGAGVASQPLETGPRGVLRVAGAGATRRRGAYILGAYHRTNGAYLL